MKTDGTNTAQRTSAIAISAEPTSFMLFFAASRGGSPVAMLRSTFSTTTMASSTTMPIASTSPNRDRLLSVNPKAAMKKNVPMSDTGMATSGMIAARHVCKNRITTSTTSTIASPMVSITASTDWRMNCVGSKKMSYLTPAGKRFDSFSISSRTPFAVSSALEPGR